jgi:hypothetical protein
MSNAQAKISNKENQNTFHEPKGQLPHFVRLPFVVVGRGY